MASNVFVRYELKFLINEYQKEEIIKYISTFSTPDIHGKSKIYSLYYDTDEKALIRNSIEKPVFKEKFRIRSYGKPNSNSPVYLEIKRKYKQMVYKKRIESNLNDVICEIENKSINTSNLQIKREFDYFINHYKTLSPYLLISYNRMAYYSNKDSNLRFTFDNDIFANISDSKIEFEEGKDRIVDEKLCVFEIKTSKNLPLDLVKKMNELEIIKASFSKVGTAYKYYN